jgi:hypothetical protein
MNSKATNVNQLFQNAEEEGLLSKKASQALMVMPDIGALIQAGLGIPVDDVTASEVILVTVMPDDSGSISSAGREQDVRDGHNLVIDSLIASKQRDNILMHTRYLNGKILFPYRPIDQAVRMDKKNYLANGGTPLYDQTVVLLGTVFAKTLEFENNGVPVRTVSLIITDGEDVHSSNAFARDVAKIVEEMVAMETHIIAAIGIDNGRTDFKTVFRNMGIPKQWVLTPSNTESEIRKAFQVFSQSAVRASQNAAAFSATAMGGFGAP